MPIGEGGAIVTDNHELTEKIILAREKGTDKHSYLSDPGKQGYYEYVTKGNSYVQSNILGALGLSQLRKVDALNDRRKRIAERYLEEFRGIANIRNPRNTENAKTNWHLFYLLVPPNKKTWFIEALKAEGVMANTHYHPLHINRYYQAVCEFSEQEFLGSMSFYDSLVRIPLFPGMLDTDVNDVVRAVKKVAGTM